MTVQVDSQTVTNQNMGYIDMCCFNNSISCLEKMTTFGIHEQTYYVDFNVGLSDTNKYLYICVNQTIIDCLLFI